MTATEVLGRLGYAINAHILRDIVGRLRDDSYQTRDSAFRALKEVGPGLDVSALRAVIGGLSEDPILWGMDAAATIVAAGKSPHIAKVMPTIVAFLDDANVGARSNAYDAFESSKLSCKTPLKNSRHATGDSCT